MRKIKFRFWDKIEKKMRYPVNSFPDLDYLYFEDIKRSEWKDEEFESMEYTGLKDKNEKEIYEGDILRISWKGGYSTIGDVCWGKYNDKECNTSIECWILKDSDNSELPISDLEGIFTSKPTVKIIGNIYENPKLLSNFKKKE